VVSTKEPFQRLVNQGMILGEMEYTLFLDENGGYLSPEQAERYDGELTRIKLTDEDIEKTATGFVLKAEAASLHGLSGHDGELAIEARSYKMSKSRGNVINPDDVIKEYGADALRLYEMFMGPLEQVKPWSMRGVEGVYRFLKRVWRVFVDDRSGTLNEDLHQAEPSREQLKVLHETIKKVTEDIEGGRYNTAISQLMIFNNEAMKWDKKPLEVMQTFLVLLSPFAPHIAEELWSRLGNAQTIAAEHWPAHNGEYLVADSFTYAIQVNGKVRATLELPATQASDKTTVLELAKKEPLIARYLAEGNLVKEIFVPLKIVNFVVKP